MSKIKTSTCMGIAALYMCCTAYGADPDSGVNPGAKAGAAAKDSQAIEEIVVTAERRSQSLQTVPLSIQAFTANELAKTGTDSNLDLQMHVPGVVMSPNQGAGNIYIRGIGNDITGTGVDGAIAVYVDGVYQSRPAGAMMNFLDVGRIEVLKGPQGTLYGRNATGGAINIVSQAPSRESEGQVDVQVGSYSQKVFRGTVSGPLSEGVAYGRLSAVINKDDGYMKNILLNTRGMNNDIQAVRGAVELTPTAALNVTVNAHYFDSSTVPYLKSLNTRVNPAYAAFKATWIDDAYTVKHDAQTSLQTKQYGADATIRYDMDWARLTSVTAARKDTLNLGFDLDMTEVNFAQIGSPTRAFGSTEDTKFFSQDFTLASNLKGPLQWTALASFMHQKSDYMFGVWLPLPKVVQDDIGTLTTDAMGIGGQVSYAVSNDVKLTAGTRYSKESKESIAVGTANGFVTATQNEKTTWTAWTPKLVAEYTPTKSVMLYASATKGFKSGGYATAGSVQPLWLPEKVTNYEAGAKSTWFDGRLRVNAAVFTMKYDDLQLQFTNMIAGKIVTLTTNAAKATSQGFELDFAAKPTARFELSGGVQVLDAKFDDYLSINPLNTAAGVVNQAGNPLLRSPDLTVNLGAQYTWPSAFEGKDVTLRLDGYHRSRIYFSAFNDPLASEDLNFLGNVQLSFESTNKTGMYGAAFIKNISNKVYHTNIIASSAVGYMSSLAPPRTVGIQLGYRY